MASVFPHIKYTHKNCEIKIKFNFIINTQYLQWCMITYFTLNFNHFAGADVSLC